MLCWTLRCFSYPPSNYCCVSQLLSCMIQHRLKDSTRGILPPPFLVLPIIAAALRIFRRGTIIMWTSGSVRVRFLSRRWMILLVEPVHNTALCPVDFVLVCDSYSVIYFWGLASFFFLQFWFLEDGYFWFYLRTDRGFPCWTMCASRLGTGPFFVHA